VNWDTFAHKSGEAILIFLLLANIVLVGSSSLSFCIRVVALEGIALGLLPLLLPGHEFGPRTVFLVAISIGLKGIVFPWLLFRALRAADVRHEVEPLVGYSVSLLFGVGTLGLSLWLGRMLNPVPLLGRPTELPLILPTALFTVIVGLFLIVSRKKALNQVLGYLVLENGIYLFGITLAHEEPFLVEMGVLLDVFVAVFVMGIAVFHISREFDHMDVDQLSTLKDWTEPQ
jgi:hydrogenase-4 component E